MTNMPLPSECSRAVPSVRAGAVTPERGDGGFLWTDEAEPHAARRREMLEQHPEIRELYGPCPRTKYICTLLVLLQLSLCYSLREAPWWLIVVVAYLVGGVINQSLMLSIHELSHNLAFKKPVSNRLFGLFINLPLGVPVTAAFREYHLMHHTHQGTDGIDTDVPTRLEARWVKGPVLKVIWLSMQGLAYGLRPLFMIPLRPNRWLVANFVIQAGFNVALYFAWGPRALAYLPISSLIVMGLHPIAGHYISEHYVFSGTQETYSYYGPLNLLAFNVGYHNEHHDFPYIAGSRLPQLRQLAPSYYEGLAHHTSWTKVLWDFVWRGDIDGTSRVKRRPS
jgi:sphingolipid delta-4 desaturase